MRAWVLNDYGSLELEVRPLPHGEGALLKVAATGICGSDLSVYKGTPAMRNRWQPPLILGHEVVGIVEEGPSQLQGRAVAVHPVVTCGSCRVCQQGKPHLCPKRIHLGFHLPGGLAEWIRVPETQLYPLPPNLPIWKGALAEPLAVALHGVNRIPGGPPEEALVLGGGGIGALVTWVLTARGTRVTVLEKNPERARTLQNLGLSQRVENNPATLLEETFSLVVDTIGTKDTLAQAQQACAPQGYVLVLGLMGLEVPLTLQGLVLKEKAVVGSYLFTPQEFQEAVALLERLPEGLVCVWPMERAPEAFQALTEGLILETKVILVW